jgi:monoamine oxidase
MPTIYTSLRAKHRHKIVPPEPPLPKSEVFAASAQETILESARQLLGQGGAPLKETTATQKPTRRVIIIGAGLAGLCAAYELRGLDYNVKVYEARSRVGGRVHTLDDFVNGKTANGKVAEGGGELIGSNHPLWNSYKHHFGLSFTDVKDYGNSPFRLKGETLTADQSKHLIDQMEEQFKLLTNLAESIVDPFEPWTNRNARALDHISVGHWISRARCSDACKHAISVMLAADNGIPTDEQSLLAVLAMVKGGGLDRYWTDTELFRCKGGNQQLAECFRDVLNKTPNTVVEGAPVETISSSNGRIRLTIKDHEPDDGDDVVLAIPPSVWHTIKIEGFPDLTRKFARPPQMGANVKYLMRFDNRFWQTFASSPTLSEDGPVDLTWETTEDDENPDFIMVAFSGSDDAKDCAEWSAQQRKANYVAAMQAPYPGIGLQIRQDKFMNWPDENWTKASYYFPSVGEVTSWGPFWKAGYGGWLHFAGEHTSYAFMGYMEGALSSGYRLARKLAIRDHIFPA